MLNNDSEKSGLLFNRKAFGDLRWLLYVLAATILFFVANHLLVRGLAVGIWDANDQFLQYHVLVADYARHGLFIHWDAWSNAGLPLSSDPQVGAFSPLKFVVGLIAGGTSSGFIFYWLLIWWLGGFGMFMLARHLRAPLWGGCLVFLGFLFCGVYTGNAEHISWLGSFSFLPFIVWRLDTAINSRRVLPAIEAGALWGLSALAGYPAFVILHGCFCALWATGRYLFVRASEVAGEDSYPVAQTSEKITLRVVIVSLILVFTVGLVVLSPTYFAFFYEGAGIQQRTGGVSREAALVDSLHPGALSTFASPYLPILKANNANQLWSYTDVSMCSIYAGALVLVLALFALIYRSHDGWRWWLALLGALSLACALGQALPLRGWLYDWFYPMRFFRHPALFRSYYLFATSVLASIATRDLTNALQSKSERAWKYFLIASCWVASCAILVFITLNGSGLNTTGETAGVGSVHLFVIWSGICILAFLAWLLPGKWRQLGVPLLLLSLAASDAFLTSFISRQTMVTTSPEYVKRWGDLDRKHSATLDLTASGLLREESSCYPNPPCKNFNNDQLITKTPTFNSYRYASEGVDLFLETASHPVLVQTAIGTERIWFSPQAFQAQPTAKNFAAFLRQAETVGLPPLIVHAPEDLIRPKNGSDSDTVAADQGARIGSLPAMKSIPVDVIKYAPDELTFNVTCPVDGWLLVTDRWARGWQAEVNEKPATVYGGNFLFRAVQVAAGQDKVRFTYHPIGFPWLIVMSWGALIVIAMFSIHSHIYRKTPLSNSDENRQPSC